jgi:hypothetical protein
MASVPVNMIDTVVVYVSSASRIDWQTVNRDGINREVVAIVM